MLKLGLWKWVVTLACFQYVTRNKMHVGKAAYLGKQQCEIRPMLPSFRCPRQTLGHLCFSDSVQRSLEFLEYFLATPPCSNPLRDQSTILDVKGFSSFSLPSCPPEQGTNITVIPCILLIGQLAFRGALAA